MNPSSPIGSSTGRQPSAGTPSHFSRTNPGTPKTSRGPGGYNLASPLASSSTVRGPATPSRTIRQQTPTATMAALSSEDNLGGTTRRPLSSSRGGASLSSPHSRHDDIHTDSDSLEDETVAPPIALKQTAAPIQVYNSVASPVARGNGSVTKSPISTQGVTRPTVPPMLPVGPARGELSGTNTARTNSNQDLRSPTKGQQPLTSPKIILSPKVLPTAATTTSAGNDTTVSPMTSDSEEDEYSYDDDFYSDEEDEEEAVEDDASGDGRISRSTSGGATAASPTSTLDVKNGTSRHSSFGREQSAASLVVGGASVPSSLGTFKKDLAPTTTTPQNSMYVTNASGSTESANPRRRTSDPSVTAPSSMNNRLLNSVGGGASKQPKYPPIPPIQVRRIEKIGRGTFGDVFKAQILSPFPVALLGTLGGGGLGSTVSDATVVSASVVMSSSAPLLTAEEAHEICSSIDPNTAFMYTTDGPIIAEKEVVIAPDMRSQKDAARQLNTLIREIHVMQKLSHKNIVKYLGSKKNDNGLSIFMEIANGGTVGHEIRVHGKIPEAEAKQYICQLLQGLEYLHQRRIVHRDLKGDNLFLMSDGTLKVGDFGTSKEMQSLKAATDSVAGTPNFMAPEVIDGTGHGIQADIWSLACCIIQMITGRAPFRNYDNQMAIMFAVIKGKIAQELPSDVSEELKDFFKVCTFKNAAERWNCAQLKEHAWLVGKERGKTFANPSEAKLKMMVKPKDPSLKPTE